MNLHESVAEFGLPVGLIAFAGICVWRAGRFVAPLITRITEKHCELIDTLNLQSGRQTEIMESQNQVMAQHGDLLRQIHLAVQSHDKSS